jgi:alpha-amylase/alpha-mannosidase (GH57 family)
VAPKFVLLLVAPLLVLAVQTPGSAGVPPAMSASTNAKETRALAGIIYFTNNTPDNVERFPVELFTRNKRRRVAATMPDQKHRFAFDGLRPGKYLLKVSWPNRCVLWYRVDLTKQSRGDVRIIMDAACAHANGSIQDLPEN